MAMEMEAHCPEVDLALSIGVRNIFSSFDGDSGRVRVSPYANKESGELLDADVYKIASKTFDRVFDYATLKIIARQMISFGDCFGFLLVKGSQINRIVILPPWEMFRVEDDLGVLLGFEQRRFLTESEPRCFRPAPVAHWRHNPENLYGRSQFFACRQDWGEYKAITIWQIHGDHWQSLPSFLRPKMGQRRVKLTIFERSGNRS